MNYKFRNSNIELLRIICMCFVIGGHIIMRYSGGDIGTTEYFIGNILRSFFMMSVNCYIIISGFFGIKLNIQKLIKISMQVSFYTISIYIITVLFGIHTINIKKDILLLFPIITRQYWYITIYVVLCIISPVLNILVENLDKNQFKIMIITILILFYILPTLSYMVNAATITLDSGYGIVNFTCLYFIGRYLNLYYRDDKSFTFYIVGFIVSSMMLFLSNHILTIIFGFYFNSFISYDTIFTLIPALMIFMAFKNVTIQSNVINKLAKYTLAIFIIHVHPTFCYYLFNEIFKINKYQGLGYISIIFIIPIVIYLSCWCIEHIRVKLFDNIENRCIEFLEGLYKKSKEKIQMELT